MASNLEKYKKDIDRLVNDGELLFNSIQFEIHPKEFEKMFKEHLKEKYEPYLKKLPNFKNSYQTWYSESLSLIKQLLPDRLNDFIKYYEKPKGRKELTYGNYFI